MSLLQKVRRGIEQSSPIYLRSKINTRQEASRNLWTFSTKGREKKISQACETVAVSSMPNMTNCHGWMKVPGKTLSHLGFDPSLDFYAIIYDFVPPSKQELGVIQAQLDFFYIIGFSVESLKADNWEGKGLLVDFLIFCLLSTGSGVQASLDMRQAQYSRNIEG